MDLVTTIANSIVICNKFSTDNFNGGDKINIAFGISAKYARPMGVAMTSIAINNPAVFLDFHVLVNSIEQDDLERLQKVSIDFPNTQITVYKVDDTFISHLPTLRYFPLPTYFRFFVPFILREQSRVLYLDSDILCLKQMSELMKLNMSKYSVAVIPDTKESALIRSKSIKLQTDYYFNAGVLLINIPEWLDQNISSKAISLLSDCSNNFGFLDQDALNLIIGNDKIILPKKWNYFSHADSNYVIPNDTVFLHCTRRPKPWEMACDRKTQAYKLYSHYESVSPWSGLPLRPPSIYSDARLFSKELFAQRDIVSGIKWYLKYLKMKYFKSN